MTDAAIVVQARMGSIRLPGKVLAPIAGRPMLTLMLDRIRSVGLPVVVATSDLERDDPIEQLLASRTESVHRGSETDVLGRVRGAVASLDPQRVVRMTADCPFADPRIIRECVDLSIGTGADYASNTLVRTHPDGLDVEVITAEALAIADAEATDRSEREHVTPFLYRRPERFRLEALTDSRLAGHERWTVDTVDDLGRIDYMSSALEDPVTATWTHILDTFGRPPDASDLHLVPILVGDPIGPPSTPGARRWSVHDPVQGPVGWIGVDVHDGVGAVVGSVSPARRTAALAALRIALSADAQVTTLDVPKGWHG